MKYKPNVWLQPGMANLFASPSLLLAADAGTWRSYSYTGPYDKPALAASLAPKEELYFFPTTLYFDHRVYFILLFCFSSSTDGTVTARRCRALPHAAASPALLPRADF